MACSGCGTGTPGATSYPGFTAYPQTAACASATTGAGVAACQNIVVIGGTYSAVFVLLKYAKRIAAANSAAKIYWIFTGANAARSNNFFGTTAEPDSVSYPHELSSNPAAFLPVPMIYSSSTAIDGLGGDDDCVEDATTVSQSSVVMYLEAIGQSVVASLPEIMDFGVFFSNATNGAVLRFIRAYTKVCDYSPAENAVVDILLNAASNPGAAASTFLMQGGAGFSRVHAFALECRPDAPAEPQYLQSLKSKIYAARSAGSRIVTLLPNLRPGTLKITQTGSTYTVEGTSGTREFSLPNVCLVRWAGTQYTNLILQTYALQRPGETIRPLARPIVNAIASLVAPRFFTSGGTTYDLNGASISYTLSDPSNGAGGAGASNIYVRTDWGPTSSGGDLFAGDLENFLIMSTTISNVTARRQAHFDPVNGRLVVQLLDCTTETLIEQNAAEIVTEMFTLIYGSAPTVPLTTLSGICHSAGLCARFSNFTTRPVKQTTLGMTLETIADCFPTALCNLFTQ